MKRIAKVILIIGFFLAAFAITGYYVSSHDVIVLNSKGMIGSKEKELIQTAFLLMLIVVIPVLVLTLVFAWKYGSGKAKHTPDWEHNYIAECCWWGVPLVIIIILAVLTWKSSHELNPFKPIENGKRAIRIQAVALNWKWLFLYPEQGVATINFVQFPEKTPIHFEITADAPMNSFWIPQLGGQIYAMPAMRTTLYLISDETGEFWGRSSNISGKGFAGMKFSVKASSEKEFVDWVSEVRSSSQALSLDEYNRLVEPSEYDPVSFYILHERTLFDQIMDKYMSPKEKK